MLTLFHCALKVEKLRVAVNELLVFSDKVDVLLEKLAKVEDPDKLASVAEFRAWLLVFLSELQGL